jgi:hypothetical protein
VARSGVTLPESVVSRRRGYGTELIERSLPYDLRAETRLEFGRIGCIARSQYRSAAEDGVKRYTELAYGSDSCARSHRSWPPQAASGIRAGDGRKYIAAETVNALCFFDAVWRLSEHETSSFLITHKL